MARNMRNGKVFIKMEISLTKKNINTAIRLVNILNGGQMEN